ncbi:hypothetical protein NKI39_19465 [Mesorhizobium sp. M0664]
MSTDAFEDLNAVPAVRLLAMLASAGAVIMAVEDPTHTIPAEQLLFSGSLLLACLAGLYSERAGVFDTGLKRKMLAGAFAAPRRPRLWLGPARLGRRRNHRRGFLR